MPTLTPTPTPAVTDTRTVCVSRQIAAACLKFVFRVLSVGCNNISDRKEFKVVWEERVEVEISKNGDGGSCRGGRLGAETNRAD